MRVVRASTICNPEVVMVMVVMMVMEQVVMVMEEEVVMVSIRDSLCLRVKRLDQ